VSKDGVYESLLWLIRVTLRQLMLPNEACTVPVKTISYEIYV